MTKFIAVDGEGGTFPNEDGFIHHQYTMLRVGDRVHRATDTYHQMPERIRWLDFLVQTPKRVVPVAYFFDYDVTMMLRDCPDEIVTDLIQRGQTSYGPYRISYRPRKELTVTAYGSRVTVSDVGTFFQSKFTDALSKWNIGTADQRADIEREKAKRGVFGRLDAQTERYNELECKLLEQLMYKFRSTCEVMGYLPQKWQGPGQLAKAMFRKEGIPKAEELPRPNLAGVWEACQSGFYGGRFETSAVGPIRTPIDEWDLGSAYPWASTTLPCMRHGNWHPSREVEPHGIYHITYTHPDGQRWYGLPHRTHDGRVMFPRQGSGWYWGVEILAAQKLGLKYKLSKGFIWRAVCNHRPFDFVHRCYSLRLALGKSEAGLALKLALNSIYGVLAQSIGSAPYGNPMYAGIITATTRARLIEAIAHSPNDVYMVATDGIYARAGTLPLDPSSELGGWEHKRFDDGMHIVMPGLYFAGGEQPKVKTRGVPLTAVQENQKRLREAWNGNHTDHITVGLRQFIGLRLATARQNVGLAGEWLATDKRIGYDWRSKRRSLRRDDYAARTSPYDRDSHSLESKPYDKTIGGLAIGEFIRKRDSDDPDGEDEWPI